MAVTNQWWNPTFASPLSLNRVTTADSSPSIVTAPGEVATWAQVDAHQDLNPYLQDHELAASPALKKLLQKENELYIV